MAGDVIGLRGVIDLLDPRKVDRATRNAINATATVQKKDSVKETVRVYNIKAKRVRDSISVRRARSGKDAAVVSYGSKRPGLGNFSTNKAKINKKTSPKVRIKKGGSLDTVERGFFQKSGFGAGSRSLFQRKGKERFPISRRTGPSPKQMYEDPIVSKRVEITVSNEFAKQFDDKLRAQHGRR